MKKPTKKTAKRKVKAGGRRRTGNKASSASASLMRMCRRGAIVWLWSDDEGVARGHDITDIVQGVAGSARAHDEHRGLRKE
jgi:hypothetical protein